MIISNSSWQRQMSIMSSINGLICSVYSEGKDLRKTSDIVRGHWGEFRRAGDILTRVWSVVEGKRLEVFYESDSHQKSVNSKSVNQLLPIDNDVRWSLSPWVPAVRVPHGDPLGRWYWCSLEQRTSPPWLPKCHGTCGDWHHVFFSWD